MRVLHLINSLETGGAEKLVTELLPRLRANDLDADLLLLNGNNTQLRQHFEKNFTGKIFALGKGTVYNPALIFGIRRYLKKYDIIHVHLFPSLYWAAFAKITSRANCKLIYTEHSTHNGRRNNKALAAADRMLYPLFQTIVTITDEVKNNLSSHLANDKLTFRTIHNGVDTKAIFLAQPLARQDFFDDSDAKILIQVSSFRDAKDQQTIIRGMKLLPHNVKLILVGEGPLLESCKLLAEELNLSSRILFLGNRMDIAQLLKTSDVVVLSSNYEGMSLSSIEGMASGRPFVASQVPGLTDIVSGAGLLFKNKDERDFEQTITRVLSDSLYYDKTVQDCLARAAHFDISTMVTEHIDLYKDTIERPS